MYIATVASEDPIQNLDVFLNIKEITGTLEIVLNYEGEDFTGLAHLERVGNLRIQTYIYTHIRSFPKLMYVIENLTVVCGNSTTFKEISFPALKNVVSNLDINSTAGHNDLEKVNFNSLESVGNNFTLNPMNSDAVTRLEFPYLTYIGGSFTNNFSSITHLSFPVLEKCLGITVNSMALEILDIPLVTQLTEILEFRKACHVDYNATIKNLEQIGYLSLPAGVTALDISGKEIGTIELADATTAILVSDSEEYSRTLITRLGFPELRGMTILNDVTVYQKDVFYLEGVKAINGTLSLNAEIFPNAGNSIGCELPDVEVLGGVDCSNMTTFKCPNLTTLNGDLIFRFPKATYSELNIDVPILKSINGLLPITKILSSINVTLTNLDVFSSLESASQVIIVNLAHLASFEGLKKSG